MKKNILFTISLLFSTIIVPFSLAKESSCSKKEYSIFNAVESKNLKMVKRCVKMGTPLNTLNEDGKTVLDIATERNYGKICRYLLRNGAMVTSMDNARMLEQNLKRRGTLMTIFGVLTGPFGLIGSGLIIGGVLSLNDRSTICVL